MLFRSVPQSPTLAITWNAPTDDGGSSITSYSIEIADETSGNNSFETATVSANTNSYSSANALTSGHLYKARITAVNVAGSGVASAYSYNQQVPGAVTLAVSNYVTLAGDTFTVTISDTSNATTFTIETMTAEIGRAHV